MDTDDLQLMTEEIAEAAQTSFKTIEERQTEMTVTVFDLLKVLCKVVEDVKFVVYYATPSTESQDPLDT